MDGHAGYNRLIAPDHVGPDIRLAYCWAVASLIETCKLNSVESLVYLADVLTRIVNGHPNSNRSMTARRLGRHKGRPGI